jgi:uncharacterized protein (TIGR03066 family)
MKVIVNATLAFAVFALAGNSAWAQDKFDKTKLVGIWRLARADDDPTPGARIEFKSDGSFVSTFTQDGKKVEITGTFTYEADKLITVTKQGDKEVKEIQTVRDLKDDKFTVTDKSNKRFEFEKVKK